MGYYLVWALFPWRIFWKKGELYITIVTIVTHFKNKEI
jgi:hypothetical protein